MPDAFCPTCDANERNMRAYRRALEEIIEYAGKLAFNTRGSAVSSSLMHIQGIAQSAMSSTGEIPRDGFKR